MKLDNVDSLRSSFCTEKVTHIKTLNLFGVGKEIYGYIILIYKIQMFCTKTTLFVYI